MNPGTKTEVNGEEATLADIQVGDEVIVQDLESLFCVRDARGCCIECTATSGGELRGGNERVVYQQNRGDSDYSLCCGGWGCPPWHRHPDPGRGLGIRGICVGHGLLRGLLGWILLVDRVRTRPENVAAGTGRGAARVRLVRWTVNVEPR